MELKEFGFTMKLSLNNTTLRIAPWIRIVSTCICFSLLRLSPALADELVYRPINPSFGGNPLNSSFLLSTAESQRPQKPSVKQSPLERFTENIQASLLNRISQKISDAILGENAQNKGSFTVGTTNINFERIGEEVKINVAGPDGTVTLQVPVGSFL